MMVAHLKTVRGSKHRGGERPHPNEKPVCRILEVEEIHDAGYGVDIGMLHVHQDTRVPGNKTGTHLPVGCVRVGIQSGKNKIASICGPSLPGKYTAILGSACRQVTLAVGAVSTFATTGCE
jgi:hypothetical protein